MLYDALFTVGYRVVLSYSVVYYGDKDLSHLGVYVLFTSWLTAYPYGRLHLQFSYGSDRNM
jgi:hypothetical protein